MQRNTQILQFFFFKMSFDILSVKKKYCKGFSSLSLNSMEHLQLDQSVSTYKLVFIVSNSSIIKTFLKINKRPTWEKRIYIELLLILSEAMKATGSAFKVYSSFKLLSILET